MQGCGLDVQGHRKLKMMSDDNIGCHDDTIQDCQSGMISLMMRLQAVTSWYLLSSPKARSIFVPRHAETEGWEETR